MNRSSLPSFSICAAAVCVVLLEVQLVYSFVPTGSSPRLTKSAIYDAVADVSRQEELLAQKKKLLSLIGPKTFNDPVLADPITKERVQITSSNSASFEIKSPSAMYRGSADSYLNLLEPVVDAPPSTNADASTLLKSAMRQFVPAVPPPLRGPINSFLGDEDNEYVPMRDLFTNPTVSFAYERGWRQGFAAAGFPGPDTEAQMAMDYFAPVAALSNPSSVIVDMSCATGLFTRRLAKSGKYGRVLGCDYSDSMLTEARRRIKADRELSPTSLKTTSLDLVRLDVGQIPMRTESVDCLHAGAAMHCWPDLNAAVSEIHRVLKPGGRYFATTFLSTYFANVATMDGQAGMSPSQQAFQYFDSVDTLKNLVVEGGFDESKVTIEVLGTACVVIRAEK
jgi:ubiquinone/menaquinone biosynthesis C-methylase UbiE